MDDPFHANRHARSIDVKMTTVAQAENAPSLGTGQERQNAMADSSTISRKAATHPDIHSQAGLALLIAVDVDNLVSIQNAYAGSLSHCADQGAQLRLRNCPKC